MWRSLLKYNYYMDRNYIIHFNKEYKSQDIMDSDILVRFYLFSHVEFYKESATENPIKWKQSIR
jgi:hypothetical protein